MKIKIDKDLLLIFERIKQKNISVKQWSQIESSDMFQTKYFNGGFDATEEAFCFSYYDINDTEYWFQITLDEIYEVLKREKGYIDIHKF